jgi:hypothetical protein
MATRASWQNCLVALPVAFFSGLGVAVGLLDDQTSSLVGVAISASLLPPAVNCGILWIAFWFQEQDWLGSSIPAWETMPAEFDADNDEDDLPPTLKDFAEGGLISLVLTLSNIVLVIISSMIMFRCKERYVLRTVLVFHFSLWSSNWSRLVYYSSLEFSHDDTLFLLSFDDSLPVEKNIFWNDLGVARKIYRKLGTCFCCTTTIAMLGMNVVKWKRSVFVSHFVGLFLAAFLSSEEHEENPAEEGAASSKQPTDPSGIPRILPGRI